MLQFINIWRGITLGMGIIYKLKRSLFRKFDGKLECESCLTADSREAEKMESYVVAGVCRIEFLEVRSSIGSVHLRIHSQLYIL